MRSNPIIFKSYARGKLRHTFLFLGLTKCMYILYKIMSEVDMKFS